MDVGKRIKELRLANQLTQDELALRAKLTKGFISLLERNKSSVSLDSLSGVLSVLGENLSTFFLNRCPQTLCVWQTGEDSI